MVGVSVGVGVLVMVGVLVGVLVLVGVFVKVDNTNTVELGGMVWEGRKVARVASTVPMVFRSRVAVHVAGSFFRVGVLVGISTVGIMVGGGKGL